MPADGGKLDKEAQSVIININQYVHLSIQLFSDVGIRQTLFAVIQQSLKEVNYQQTQRSNDISFL